MTGLLAGAVMGPEYQAYLQEQRQRFVGLMAEQTPPAELRTCVQEAGHATIAHLKGLHVQGVSVHGDETSRGRVSLHLGNLREDDASLLRVWRIAQSAAAGFLAEEAFLGFETDDILEARVAACDNDFALMVEALAYLERRHGVKRTRQQVFEAVRMDLFRPPAPRMVLRVAASLSVRTAIARPEFLELVRDLELPT